VRFRQGSTPKGRTLALLLTVVLTVVLSSCIVGSAPGAWPDVVQDPCPSISSRKFDGRVEIEFDTAFVSAMEANQEEARSFFGARIQEQFKQRIPFSALLKHEAMRCNVTGEARISGDWKDHLGLINRTGPTLDIALNGAAIAGSHNFKLFAPNTKDIREELVAEAIFRSADIPFPLLRVVDVRFGGLFYRSLLQDTDPLQFTEFGRHMEVPLEFNEEPIWNQKLRYRYPGAEFRVESAEFLRSSREHTALAARSLAAANSRIVWPVTPDVLGDAAPTISFDQKRDMELALFALLAILADGWHGLQLHNRKILVEPLTLHITPAYYDLEPGFYRIVQSLADGAAFREINFRAETLLAREFPNGLDQLVVNYLLADSFWEKVSSYLSEFGTREVDLEIHSAENLAVSLKTYFESSLLSFGGTDSNPSHRNFEPAAGSEPRMDWPPPVEMRVVVTDATVSEYLQTGRFEVQACVLESCVSERLSTETVRFALRHRLEEYAVRSDLERVGAVFSSNGQDLRPLASSRWQPGPIAGMFYSGVVRIEVSPDDRQNISISLMSKDSRVLFLNTELDSVKIKISVKGSLLRRIPEEHEITQDGITGCLSFRGVSFRNVSIDMRGGWCEDAVHIDRSFGTLKELSVSHALADALDADRSDLSFDRVEISSARNDCLDFSFGSYLVREVVINDCGDKGVSVGEWSTFEVHTGLLDTRDGLVIKDGSSLEITDSLFFKGGGECVSAYQKKLGFETPFISQEVQGRCRS